MSEKLQVSSAEVSVRKGLEEIFNPDSSTFGHGTRIDTAKKILRQGLEAKVPDLFSTAIPIFDSSKSFAEQAEEVIQRVKHCGPT